MLVDNQYLMKKQLALILMFQYSFSLYSEYYEENWNTNENKEDSIKNNCKKIISAQLSAFDCAKLF